ncbi:class I SAM-dependent methyltransferase [Streptomyces sp. NPDC051546]|uniref:class I SAM-dependent methyltransferase n=1 Tax=Streptomyces sp. NPDC051546 TaxID=3365655 RepID=UPI0037B94521
MRRQRRAYHQTELGNREETARDRLLALEAAFDGWTRKALCRTRLQESWRALEIGAGAGSVAFWLADQLTEGEVVATDLDLTYLPDSHPRVRTMVHDLTVDSFSHAEFNLIHARAVYEHLADPEVAAARTLSWLAPGGWIVIEGVDFTFGVNSPHPAVASGLSGMIAGMAAATGLDSTFERTLPALFHQHGLVDVSLCVQPMVCGDGGAAEQFLRISLEQLKPMLVRAGTTEESIDGLLHWMDSPGNLDTVFAIVTVSARRPGADS